MAADESQQKMQAGDQASHLLESQAMKDAVLRLRNTYVESWMQAKTVEAREDCHRCIVALADLLKDLKSTITTGQLTRKRLDTLQDNAPQTWVERLNG